MSKAGTMAGGGGVGDPAPRPPRSRTVLVLLSLLAALLFVGLLALGTWQVRRLGWKQDLIAQVESRIHAAPVPAPGPAAWPRIDAASAAYRRVTLSGHYLSDRSVRTQAATAYGSGFWLMTPLRTDRGFTVLVNRGFVPPRWRDPGLRDATVTVTGLLRITEPGGGFLRHNDPAAGRWYSRDVAAIATAQHLDRVAPYFVDAAADPQAPANPPIGGLTVIAFPNNHLSYAITWYVLALMVAGGWWLILRHERRLRCG